MKQLPAYQPARPLWWRIVNSWWVLLPLLSVGLLTWVGFLVAAALTKRWHLWVATAIYSVMVAIELATSSSSQSSWQSTVFDICLGITMIGGTVHAALLNGDYLRRLDQRRQARQQQVLHHQYQQFHQPYGYGPQYHGQAMPAGYPPMQPPAAPAPGTGQPPYGQVPTPMPTPGWLSSDTYYAPGQAPIPKPPHQAGSANPFEPPTDGRASGQVDVNQCTAPQLIATGVQPPLAERIAESRQRRGGFSGLDDLVRTVGLQPHEMTSIADKVTFGPWQRPAAPPQPGGRYLDL